ncbi:pyridoxal phosphate-dependent transferase [Russula aff. rugulosa BPL654]|nr:pyridoxal phosphate-dependent transferase [Russula aff. rugulosa BPL654]
MSCEKRTNAIDHSHHLSDLARRYGVSPLKGLQKYFSDDLIPFAGGLPSPEYFPFTSVSADVLPTDAFPLVTQRTTSSSVSSSPLSWLWRLFGSGNDDSTRIQIPREPREGDGGLNLATALQYSPATGLAPLQKIIREFTERIHAPAYADWTTLVDAGNTDGWSRLTKLLLNPGDTLLVEEWSYPSALATALPLEIRWKAVPMDGQGMRADSLRAILAGWNVERDGPRCVPVWNIPFGTTINPGTYIIIAEDDPYYFLQAGEYVPKSKRKAAVADDDDVAGFVRSLVPTFLRVDTQGRVIRMDTFSKTIAPGIRLGWFTCSPLFAERLERIGEVSTHAPCGLGQVLVAALLSQWTFDSHLRWLRGLREQYKLRRDFFVDCLAEEFDLIPTPASTISGGWAAAVAGGDHMVLSAYRRGEKSRPLLSLVPPSRVYVPDKTDEEDGSVLTPERQFWIRLIKAGVLTAPGWVFSPTAYAELGGSVSPLGEEGRQVGHLRFSYTPTNVSGDNAPGINIFARTLREFSRV